MEEPSKSILFADCMCCGKATFIDLLDENNFCEYCAEVHQTKSHSIPRKRQRSVKRSMPHGNHRIVATNEQIREQDIEKAEAAK